MLVTWWTRVSPPNFVMLFGLAMPRIVGGVQVSVGRANRLMSQVIANVAQIHTVIGNVGTGRVPQPAIGRATCRARVGQYVSISVVAVPLQKKKKININT